jgi:Bacterial cellulose synthase subunit
VRLIDAFLTRVPLDPGQKCERESDAEVSAPVIDLELFSKPFSFNFAFQPVTHTGCQTGAPVDLEGRFCSAPQRSIVSDEQHSAALPNLEWLANAGLPFTFRSDLGAKPP